MTIELSAGLHILGYTGPADLPLTGAQKPAWLTSANVASLSRVSANGAGYVSFLPISTTPPFTTLPAVATGSVVVGYILLLKQAISVDSDLFGLPALPTGSYTTLVSS